ncbi:calcium-binding protein [Paracoccus pacificus]|uniref:Calcium-binding protein n=1 Tax=Paracoccus pacificus TaxID=1463598 RepID=A0ABW4R4G0_9RHOB
MATIPGTANNDLIYGTSGDDLITGLGGVRDTLYGGMGRDTIDGGDGMDTIFGDFGYYGGYGDPDTLLGGAGGDYLYDYSDGNLFDGGADDDTIYAYGSNSTIRGGLGDDSIYDYGGRNIINGGEDSDFYYIYAGGSTINGGGGADKLVVVMPEGDVVLDTREGLWGAPVAGAIMTSNIRRLSVSAGNSTILGGNSNHVVNISDVGSDRVILGAGRDQVAEMRGVANRRGNDYISTGAGDDEIRVTSGRDTILAGAGDDEVTVWIDDVDAVLDGGEGRDILEIGQPSGNDLTLDIRSTGSPIAGALRATGFEEIGQRYQDGGLLRIIGGPEDTTIRLDASNAFLDLGNGRHEIDGAGAEVRGRTGTGSDRLIASLSVVDLSLGAGNDYAELTDSIGRVDAGTGNDRFSILWVRGANDAPLLTQAFGGEGNDVFRAINTAQLVPRQVVLDGGAGDDSFASTGWSAKMLGGAGNDAMIGSNQNDILVGGAGNDVMDGRGGIDRAVFLTNASVQVDLNQSQQNTGEGIDSLIGIENVQTANGNDYIRGSAGANLIVTAGGNDRLEGLAGNDILDGGAGVDTAFYLANVQHIISLAADGPQNTGEGVDVLRNVENLQFGNGNDRGTGSAAANMIAGNWGNDTLSGGGGNDTLYGGGDRDSLDGGTGNDVLWGGAAADSFVFRRGSGHDLLADFQDNVDTIVTNYSAAQVSAAVQNASYSAQGAVLSFAGGDQWILKGVSDARIILDDITYM